MIIDLVILNFCALALLLSYLVMVQSSQKDCFYIVRNFNCRLFHENIYRRFWFSDKILTNYSWLRVNNKFTVKFDYERRSRNNICLYRKIEFRFYVYLLYLWLFCKREEK